MRLDLDFGLLEMLHGSQNIMFIPKMYVDFGNCTCAPRGDPGALWVMSVLFRNC